MKLITIFFVLLFIVNCSNPKTVLICGDHVCINKAEAKQYFEENLSLEVKIIDHNIKKEVDLVELNLRNNNNQKKISIDKKKFTNKKLKILSNKEKKDIKNKIKKKNEKITKKEINRKTSEKIYLKKTRSVNNNKKIQKNVNKLKNEIEDVCSLIKVCNIDEISKYLLKMGNKKDYPDITKRQ